VGGRIVVRIGTAEATGVITAIVHAVDPGLLASDGAEVIGQNHVGEIEIELSQPLATDPYTTDAAMGRIVLDFDGRIAGGGLVLSVETENAGATSKATIEATIEAAVVPARLAGVDAEALRTKAATLARLLAELAPGQRIAHLR